jgi:alkaline phosphatase D
MSVLQLTQERTMKIAFTSCMRIESFPEQLVWKQIAQEKPDYLFLLGDQIYMDFFLDLGEPKSWSDNKFEATMLAKYQAQWDEPNFKSLFSSLRQKQNVDGGVYGTWDDHDFAWNNACGIEVPPTKQAIARKLFNQFMECNTNPNKMYYSVLLKHTGKIVGKAIFLDTRSYRNLPGKSGRLLGNEQLEFLKKELNHPHPLTILCAGTPIRATGNGWLRYSEDYSRFLNIIGDREILFLSGDIHENAFLPPSGGTKLFEIISSGAAIYKYGKIGERRNYGILDWSPDEIKVKLVDRHQVRSYSIKSADFLDYEEHDPKPLDSQKP